MQNIAYHLLKRFVGNMLVRHDHGVKHIGAKLSFKVEYQFSNIYVFACLFDVGFKISVRLA